MIAYFSMEVGLDAAMPTYSGGLGVLAGDTLRAAADLKLPLVGVTLLHRKGYFRQHLDAGGKQSESACEWSPEAVLDRLDPVVTLVIEGRTLHIRAWCHRVSGISGGTVPIYFLDTDLPENSPEDRTLTDHLYGGDTRYRLRQEVVLGLGGFAMLPALGHGSIFAYHMNEGHSSLLALGLLEQQMRNRDLSELGESDNDAARQSCVFTTHTPVVAGHDQFPLDLVRQVLDERHFEILRASGCCLDETLNMTYLALSLSRYVNGVAMRHGQVARGMFPGYPIDSITNGVHAATWTSQPFQDLFDSYIPAWRRENMHLRYAVGIPLDEVRQAHVRAKHHLLAEIRRRTEITLEPDAFTIGFARRAATYKRADLLFSEPDRLKGLHQRIGPLQVVYAGKAHPHDEPGKAMIQRVFEAAEAVGPAVRVVYLEDYDIALAKYLCAGVDLWLNTPQRPQEASGTSGMKAALNGIPSLSVLDGWWIEGHVEGVTGWSIGDSWDSPAALGEESESLYHKLEHHILPLFYGRPAAFSHVMRSAIALNGSFFNAQRMLIQYLRNAYSLSALEEVQPEASAEQSPTSQ
jgi:starch phosphorylase